MDTDFFVKKIKKLHEIKNKPDIYTNVVDIGEFRDDEEHDHAKVKDEYAAKNSSPNDKPQFHEFEFNNNVTDEVEIIEYYGLLVYSRPGYDVSEFNKHPNIQYIQAPLIHLSATYIRNNIRVNKSIKYLVPDKVEQFIKDRKLYL